jgi:dTDP-4-dehydrorhamnose reductase
MRLLIAGWQGQLARALAEAAPRRDDVRAFAIGRPALDICELPTIERALNEHSPDVVINSAAYTAVDQAETDESAAFALNAKGAGALAAAAAKRGVAVIHVSTDYVFDGTKPSPYVETDPTSPLSAYGRTKLAGEQAVASANPRHVILRTAWVHSPWGKNFVKTMLRLGAERDELRVVDDQVGSPTYAPHLATAILDIAARIGRGEMRASDWGLFHAAGSGETSWYGLAREVFAVAAKTGHKTPRVEAITASEYPTPAKRPANSRLDCGKLERHFGIGLPDWRAGVNDCLSRLAAQ